MPNLAKQISYLLNWLYFASYLYSSNTFFLFIDDCYLQRIYLYLYLIILSKKTCTEISAALRKICHIKLCQRQCLGIRTITLLVRQIYFMIYHHSDLLRNTFVNDRPIKHTTAAFFITE